MYLVIQQYSCLKFGPATSEMEYDGDGDGDGEMDGFPPEYAYEGEFDYEVEQNIVDDRESGSVKSKEYTKRKRHEHNQMMYSNYRVVTRIINGTKCNIGLFVTPTTPGALICDAVTGNKFNFKVGSKGEDYFFKVKLATNEIGHDVHLYFETPVQCEKYLKAPLSDATKEQWKEKYMRYVRKINTAKA